MEDGVRSTVHPEDVPVKAAQQGEAGTGQGTSGLDKGKARGRPRKETAGGNGFSVPAKPEVNHEKSDARKFIVLPFRVYHDKRLHRQALRVLVMLAAHANRNGFTWVGIQKLAEDEGVTFQAISNQLVKLKELGYVEETSAPYYGGPSARTATIRIIYDPTMSAEDVLSRDSDRDGDKLGQVGVESNIRGSDEAITSLNDEVVNRPSKVDLESQREQLTAEVLTRYRREGLEPPGKWRLAEEVAALASLKARGMA
jgi:DNA-binding transcriptional ArsR family regulator